MDDRAVTRHPFRRGGSRSRRRADEDTERSRWTRSITLMHRDNVDRDPASAVLDFPHRARRAHSPHRHRAVADGPRRPAAVLIARGHGGLADRDHPVRSNAQNDRPGERCPLPWVGMPATAWAVRTGRARLAGDPGIRPGRSVRHRCAERRGRGRSDRRVLAGRAGHPRVDRRSTIPVHAPTCGSVDERFTHSGTERDRAEPAAHDRGLCAVTAGPPPRPWPIRSWPLSAFGRTAMARIRNCPMTGHDPRRPQSQRTIEPTASISEMIRPAADQRADGDHAPGEEPVDAVDPTEELGRG